MKHASRAPLAVFLLGCLALAEARGGGPQGAGASALPAALADRLHEASRLVQQQRLGGVDNEVCSLFESLFPLAEGLQPIFQEFADTHAPAEVDAFARGLRRRLPVLRTDLGRDYRLGATVSVDATSLAEGQRRGANADLLRGFDRFQHGPIPEFGRPVFVRPSDCAPAYWCDSLKAALPSLVEIAAAKDATPCLATQVRARLAPALAELAATRCVCESRADAEDLLAPLTEQLDAGWPGLSAKLVASLRARETRFRCNRC